GWYRWNRAIFPDYPVWRDGLEKRLEAAAIRTADRVICVTDRMAAAFRAQYPDLPERHFSVVSNGFDPRQFDTPAPPDAHAGWHVLHAGALYYGRSLAAFLDAVRQLRTADCAFATDFRLTLLGPLDQRAQGELALSQLGGSVELRAQAPHGAAIAA